MYKLYRSMSSAVPVLNENDTDLLVKWIQKQCSSNDFDPSSSEFRAALALLASNDKYHQHRRLGLVEAQNSYIVGINSEIEETVVNNARLMAYRFLIRKHSISPQIGRMITGLPSHDQGGFDNSSFSYNFLLPHTEGTNQSPISVFRRSFLSGSGQNPSFMTMRKIAILSSFPTNQIPNLQIAQNHKVHLDSEIKRLSVYRQQFELRKQLVKFALDPLSPSLPDFHNKLTKAEPNLYISPQHVGILSGYELSQNQEKNKKRGHIHSIIQQAHRFKNGINASFQRIENTVKALNSYMNRKNREQNKNSDYVRLNALKRKDMNEYRKLVNQMKDDRIRTLLDRTDSYMKELSNKIKSTHESVSNGDGVTSSSYELALKLPSNVVQPINLKGSLKDYQLKGLQWLVSLYSSQLNGILADEMGLGKTIQTIALLGWLYENKQDRGPHLICAPLGTIMNWYNEFKQWLPVMNVLCYKGNQIERKDIEKRFILRGSNVNAILTSYEFVVKDKSILGRLDYSYIVIDEAHKLKNHQGKLSQALSKSYNCKSRLLLTGTPLQNNPKELWSLLNFVLPTIFNDHRKFEEWFSAPFAKNNENVQLSQEEQWIVIQHLHSVLRPFLFRRLVSEVANELPEIVESSIRCSMSAWQRAMYNTIVEDSSIVLPGFKVVRLDNQTMQCRKICDHPYLFYDNYYINSDFIRVSGKFEILDRILPKLKKTGHRVLIFSQMTEVLKLLEDLMTFMDLKYLKLDGATKSELRQVLIDTFNNDKSYFVFLLSTRAGGLGLNLQSADTVILYDNDWNPFADLQARARVHRIGQQKAVRVISLVTANSVEERVMDRADQKKSVEEKIIEMGKFDDSSNNDDRKKMFYQQNLEKINQNDLAEVYDDDQINHIIARTTEELEIFEQMDTERKDNYQKQWEQSGHHGDYPALMTQDEIPDYLKMPIQELIKEDEVPSIRKSRSMSYAAKIENITDNEYARLIDRGEDPTEHYQEIQQKNEKIDRFLKQVRVSCKELFDDLPSPKELPEYYQIIESPITLKQIRRRAKDGEYDSIEDAVSEVKLMASNAMKFNSRETEFYLIAEELNRLCTETINNERKRRTKEIPEETSYY